MHSAKFKGASCLQILIQNGANLNLQANNGMTALAIAASAGSTNCVDTLISAGADVNLASMEGVTALVLATSNGHRDCMRKLIAAGTDINNDKRGRNITPLMAAAQGGHIGCIKELIQAGADLNIQNRNGATAFVIAGYFSCYSAVTLIKAGAEIEIGIGLVSWEQLLLRNIRGTKISRIFSQNS